LQFLTSQYCSRANVRYQPQLGTTVGVFFRIYAVQRTSVAYFPMRPFIESVLERIFEETDPEVHLTNVDHLTQILSNLFHSSYFLFWRKDFISVCAIDTCYTESIWSLSHKDCAIY